MAPLAGRLKTPLPIREPARVLSTHTPALFEEAVRQAADLLRAGEVVVVPTETVYGLAANAWDVAAVRRIFERKGRPAGNPVIVHVASGLQARDCAGDWPEMADRLASAFWPGPLTLVVRRGRRIPDAVTAGGPTVGIRWPSHPFMQALIRACGFPLAAPSANLSNAISPTQAEHVLTGMGDRVPLIVDGGACQVGIESTVVDVTATPVRILRPGMIGAEAIASVAAHVGLAVPDRTRNDATSGEPLRSPGQMARHYAPRARLWIGSWRDDGDLRARLRRDGVDAATAHVLAHQVIPGPGVAGRVCVIPADPEAFARALYAEWHRCDELGAGTIVMEAVPATPEWSAIEDRLARAAARA
ncbi:MAG: threonylcarbamoyl-AMP synthase [Verrucomicrobiales bacterium]|nr:threonylcarbamoyl-AMP synthase [Verrucomicrobiales bacterium]